MLITLFSVLFILGTYDALAAGPYHITYLCNQPNETPINEIFVQYYAWVNDPCAGTTDHHYITTGQNFGVPDCLNGTTSITTSSKCLPPDWDYDNNTKCLTSFPYDPKPLKNCIKTGYTLIGWYDPTNNIILYYYGYGDAPELTEEKYSGYKKETMYTTYTWEDNLTLHPIWKSNSITCNAGTYLPQAADNCADCPSGYYCPGVSNTTFNGEEQGIKPCPAGSTSSTGAKEISDCFVEPFVTHFTFGDTTFSLPLNHSQTYKINYNPD